MMSDDLIKAELSLENNIVLEQVYRENKGVFMSFAKRYDLPDEDIIDIYQDAMVALVEHAKREVITVKLCDIYLFNWDRKVYVAKAFKEKRFYSCRLI